ncbi:hypothetical protein [Nonomuraea sp. NPDC048826]|uniref:hypothetical protein n=1 Tax=Nonomuraea sp. NPDC048826 TaxID=3364347 RepID=UPI00371DF21B
MRILLSSTSLATLALLTTACAPDVDDVAHPSLPPSPVVDSTPYLCKFVPDRAFRLVSDTTGILPEKTDGNDRNGNCRAPDTSAQALEVWWMQEGGMPKGHLDFLMNDRRKVYSRYGGVVLPADLGEGMAAYVANPPVNDQPYNVSAKFRCGTMDRLIDISLPKISKGRDAMKDLTDLMRIAQKRYAEVHNCTLKTG